MAIYIYTGRPRHGKTYQIARLVTKMLKAKERVFSNVKINLGVGALKKFDESIVGSYASKADRENPEKLLFYWTNMHEWEHFEKGNIICDEMQRYFNARLWENLSEETEVKLQQHGKENLNIYGTTQHYSRIDVSLRILVEGWLDVETIFGNPDNRKPFLGLKLFRVTSVEGIEYFEPYIRMKIQPDLQEQYDIPMRTKLFFFRKKYAVIYDTTAKVGRSEPMPLVHKERKCEMPGCDKVLVTHK